MKQTWGRSMVVALLVAAQGVISFGALAPAKADGPAPVTITWPEVTEFNPDRTSYVVTIEGGDPNAHYRLRGSTGQDFGAHNDFVGPGQQVVNFRGGGPGGTLTLRIYSCNEEFTECSDYYYSPELTVWRGLAVDHYLWRLGPKTPIQLKTKPAFVEQVDVAWSVLDDGVLVAEGESSKVPVAGPVPAIGPQPALVDGHDYEFRTTVSAETATYGQLTATTSRQIVWDTTIEPVLEVEMLDSANDTRGEPSLVAYPLLDGYGDWLRFAVRNDDLATMTVNITDATGGHVNAWGEYGQGQFTWSARHEGGSYPLPGGRYTATISVTDWAGNEAVVTTRVRISHQRLARTVWRRTVTPAASLEAIPKPRCGSLERPARADWPTSFGYRSKRRCASSDVSVMQTIHGVSVPDSIEDSYGRVRLIVVGGAAKSRPRSRLNYGLSPGSAGIPRPDVPGHTLDGSIGRHASRWEWGVVEYHGAERLVRWGVGTFRGSRYDVKRFVIEVERYVLR
jgi:hypothetical protein